MPPPENSATQSRTFAAFQLLFALFIPLLLSAQTPQPAGEVTPLVGKVMRGDQPVPGSRVILHRVTPQEAGEVGTAVTDSAGQFRFLLESVPNAEFNVFFTTAEYLSVRYFGPAIHADSANAEYIVEVYDTARALPLPVKITRRDVIMLPGLDGSWEVDDVVEILNPTQIALVSPQGTPTWDTSVPAGATDFEAGQGSPGDVMPTEVNLVGDRVLLMSPITPGIQSLFMRYRLPKGPADAVLAIDEPIDTVNVFVRQPSHLTSIAGLQTTKEITVDQEKYLMYTGVGLAPGNDLKLEWGRLSGPPIDPVLAAVIATLLLLGVGAWAAVRNQRA
jgi:hypothetical protein